VNDREALYATYRAAGLKLLSDTYCCQLLAWLLVYGGGEEKTVLDEHLNTDIREAQQRLNIYGGKRPNVKLVAELQQYIQECEQGRVYPPWVKEIEQRYKLTRRDA
jgi:hypothetical protein